MTTAYRDDLEAAFLRRDILFGRRLSQLARVSHEVADIHAARSARIAFGACAAAGALAMGACAAARMLDQGLASSRDLGVLTAILVGTWPMAIVAHAVTRALARRRFETRLAASIARSGDPRADLARLEDADPRGMAMEIVSRAEVASVALPLMGLALLLPLTLHLLVALALSSGSGSVDLSGFDGWICWSVLFVGHAHLVLAALCWRYANKARKLPGETVRRGWRSEAAVALGLTALSAVVPTIVYAPVLVLATGAVPVALMFYLSARGLVREREILARQSPA